MEEIELVDRGIGTMADVSTLADLKHLSAYFMLEMTETSCKLRVDHLMAVSL